jgi:hypothetical protein
LSCPACRPDGLIGWLFMISHPFSWTTSFSVDVILSRTLIELHVMIRMTNCD